MDRLQLDYFYGAQADSFSFYYFPKILIQDACFNDMSLDSKILYGLLLASNSSSIENGWLDPNKFVFIKYSVNTVCENLGCGRNKAISLLKELISKNLLEIKRAEIGKPTEYYLKRFFVATESLDTKSVLFSRFTVADTYTYSFFRLPAVLFTDKCFSELSSEAKLLYSILLDRMSLSTKENWIDEQGRIYVEYELEKMIALLNRSKNSVYKLLSELDMSGLIEKKRRGQGRSNIFYVKNFMSQHIKEYSADQHTFEAELAEYQKSNRVNTKNQTGKTSPEYQKINRLNTKKYTGTGLEAGNPEPKKSNSIYTKDNTNYQKGKSYPSSKGRNAEKTAKEWMEGYAALKKKIAENIERDALIQQFDSDIVDGSISLIVRELCVQKEFITISGDKIPRALFAERMLMLRKKHVEYALNSVLSVMDTIKSLEPYLLKTLFLAPETYTLSTIQKAAAKQNSLKKEAPSKNKKSGFDYQDQREYDYDEIKRRKLLAKDKQKGFYYEDQREYDYKELEKSLLLKK